MVVLDNVGGAREKGTGVGKESQPGKGREPLVARG